MPSEHGFENVVCVKIFSYDIERDVLTISTYHTSKTPSRTKNEGTRRNEFKYSESTHVPTPPMTCAKHTEMVLPHTKF